MKTNVIYNGETSQIIKTIDTESIDLIITSPPYDDLRDYEKDVEWNNDIFEKIAIELNRVIKKGGVIVWVVGDKVKNGNKSLTSFRQALYFQSLGLNVYDVIIYKKTGTSPPNKNRYFNTFEYMFIFSKGKPKTINLLKDKKNKWAGTSTFGTISRREKNGNLTKKEKKIIKDYSVRTNIWEYTNGMGFVSSNKIAHNHPAIFPEKLVEDNLLAWSEKGDLVLDCFMGSGTTAYVCKKMQRRYIGIEISKKYCNIANIRLKEINYIQGSLLDEH